MKVMKRILGIVTFSCKRITEIVETKEASNLSLWGRVRYKWHLAACQACRSYEKQSTIIGAALIKLMSSPQNDVVPMDEVAKKKILDKIKNVRK